MNEKMICDDAGEYEVSEDLDAEDAFCSENELDDSAALVFKEGILKFSDDNAVSEEISSRIMSRIGAQKNDCGSARIWVLASIVLLALLGLRFSGLISDLLDLFSVFSGLPDEIPSGILPEILELGGSMDSMSLPVNFDAGALLILLVSCISLLAVLFYKTQKRSSQIEI